MKNKLIEKLNDKSAKISILGLGYVGLPLMLRYIEVGFNVIGIDIDQEKVLLSSPHFCKKVYHYLMRPEII